MATASGRATEPKGFLGFLERLHNAVPAEARLAVVILIAFLAAFVILKPSLDGWQWIALSGTLALFSAVVFFAWLFRPARGSDAAPALAPPYAVVEADLFLRLAGQPVGVLLALDAGVNALRRQILEIAQPQRKGAKPKDRDVVVKQLMGVLKGQPESVVRSLLAWAEQTP